MTEQREVPEPASEAEGAPEKAARPKPSPSPRPRPGPRSENAATNRPEAADAGHVRARFGVPGRRSAVLACLAATALLLTAAAAWFAFETHGLRAGQPEENSALVDAAATAEVREQISSAVEGLFSYNYASLDRTRRAAERVLLDTAQQNYRAKLSDARETAEEHKLVRTASTRAIGVRSLRGDTARVLVFLDQQTVADGGSERRTDTAYLDVVAKKVGGSWKIAKMSGAS